MDSLTYSFFNLYSAIDQATLKFIHSDSAEENLVYGARCGLELFWNNGLKTVFAEHDACILDEKWRFF